MEAYSKEHVYVPPVLAKWLRPHQREGVQFMYECVMGLKDFPGAGCILADDMGLGKVSVFMCVTYFFQLDCDGNSMTILLNAMLLHTHTLHRPFNPSL